MTSPTLAAMEAVFRQRYPGSRRHTGVGVFVGEALSPGDLHLNVLDEETGCPPASVLRAAGWPIPADVQDEDPYDPPMFTALWTLPWLGSWPLSEGGDLLTIDGFHRAPLVAIEPESSGMFWGASWRAGFWLQPGEWLAASVSVMEAPAGGSGRHGGLYLGLRRLTDRDAVAAAITQYDEHGRLTMRRLLGIDDAAMAAALTDTLSGVFR